MKDSKMLLKTNVEKMSVSGHETMLMKTNELWFSSNDVNENKGVSENRSDE
jgi:hypothetical protein